MRRKGWRSLIAPSRMSGAACAWAVVSVVLAAAATTATAAAAAAAHSSYSLQPPPGLHRDDVFAPASSSKDNLADIFVEEGATVHAQAQAQAASEASVTTESAAELLAEIEAQDKAAKAAQTAQAAQGEKIPPPLSAEDAKAFADSMRAALGGDSPSSAFGDLSSSTPPPSSPPAPAGAPYDSSPVSSSFSLSPDIASSLAELSSALQDQRMQMNVGAATAATAARADAQKDVPLEEEEDEEEDKAIDLASEHHNKKTTDDPYQLHHDATAPLSAASYQTPFMNPYLTAAAASNGAVAQRLYYPNPYAVFLDYFSRLNQANQHHSHHHHRHRHSDDDSATTAPHSAAPSSPSNPADAARFKQTSPAAAAPTASSHNDDDDDDDDDDDGDDADDDDGDDDDGDDDDDDDDYERRRREKKRKEQEKLKYDDAMNKMRFSQTHLDVDKLTQFEAPPQSGYSAPVEGAGPQFNTPPPAPPTPMQSSMYPAPAGPMYPSFLQSSSQAAAQSTPGIPGLNGVPMPFFPPTPGVIPAPNQVPSGSQVVNGVYPANMVQPTTANMAFSAAGMTQSPGVNPAALPMGPNALNAGMANYPFGGTAFIELDSVPLQPAPHPHEALPSNAHAAKAADKHEERRQAAVKSKPLLSDEQAEQLLGEEFGAVGLLELDEGAPSSAPDAVHPYVDALGRTASSSSSSSSSSPVYHSPLSPQHFEPFPLLSS